MPPPLRLPFSETIFPACALCPCRLFPCRASAAFPVSPGCGLPAWAVSYLAGFDGFLVVGYLPMQGGVLPFQCLDLVAPEKRADALGDVGGCGGCRPFQLLGLYLFFRPS